MARRNKISCRIEVRPHIDINGRTFFSPKEAAKWYAKSSSLTWSRLGYSLPDLCRTSPCIFTKAELDEVQRRKENYDKHYKKLYNRVYKIFKRKLDNEFSI